MRYRPFDQRLTNPKTNIGCAIVFVLIVLVYAANTRLVGFSTSVATDMSACTMAQEFVTNALKAPSTAQFASCLAPATTVSQRGRIWIVHSYVDAQNGFGAMLRNDYTAELIYYPASDSWTLVSLTLNN